MVTSKKFKCKILDIQVQYRSTPQAYGSRVSCDSTPEKEIQTPGVLYQYKTPTSKEQKGQEIPPILPAHEAAKLARALRDREKQFQAQRHLQPAADQQEKERYEK